MARVALTDDNGALYGAPATWLNQVYPPRTEVQAIVDSAAAEAVAADATVAQAAADAVSTELVDRSLTSNESVDTGGSAEWYDETGAYLFAVDGLGTDHPHIRDVSVVYPSGDTTGVTDTAAVNDALASASRVVLMPGDWYQNASYVIPSDTHMHCEGPFESFLVAGSNSNLVTNDISETATTNIALTGRGHVRFDGNAANQTRLDTSPNYAGWRNIGIHFVNVDGLHVEGITWANTAMFGALCTGVRNAHWRNNRVEQDFTQPNQDGLDIGPACHHIWIDGLTGNTEDDVHSIFGKYSTSQQTVHPLYLPANAIYQGWPAGALYSAEGNSTHDIYVHRSHVNAGKNFFRIQAAEGSKVYNIHGTDIRHMGDVPCRALVIFGEMIPAYIDAPPAADGSDFYNMTFDGFEGSVLSLVYADSYFRDVVVRNSHLTHWDALVSRRSATTDPSAGFSRVTIDGVTSSATGATNVGNLVTLIGGMVARDVEFSNVNLPEVNRVIANTDSTAENVRFHGRLGTINTGAFYVAGTATTTAVVDLRADTTVANLGTMPALPAGSNTISNGGA